MKWCFVKLLDVVFFLLVGAVELFLLVMDPFVDWLLDRIREATTPLETANGRAYRINPGKTVTIWISNNDGLKNYCPIIETDKTKSKESLDFRWLNLWLGYTRLYKPER